MSKQRRMELELQATADVAWPENYSPCSRNYLVSGGGGSQWDHSWRFFAYSYERAFEALWDAAYARQSGVFDYPLLFVCRQSIELWLKAAIEVILGSTPPRGHELGKLWQELIKASTKFVDLSMDGMYPKYVKVLIQVLDVHDKKGDRFRYPTGKKHASYPNTVTDLEELYQAHSLITGFCDAVCTQVEAERERKFSI